MPTSSASLHHDATDPSSAQQPGLPTGPTHVEKTRPTGALLRAAMDALHVHGTRRAVSYELLTYWSPGGAVFPSVLTLSQGVGKRPRCVRAHLAGLDRIGLWTRERREGETNVYALRLPGALVEPKQSQSAPSTHLHAVDVKPAVSTSEGGTGGPGGAALGDRGGRSLATGISNQRSNQEKSTSSRARLVCPDCGNSWPNKAEYGTECYKCSKQPKASTRTPAEQRRDKPESKACTCGTAYRNAYAGRCVECNGAPSGAQRDALREKQGGVGAQDRGVDHRGGVRPAVPGIDAPPLEAIASTPPRAETETRQPQEPEHDTPADNGEPRELQVARQQFYRDMAKWRVKGETHDKHT